MILKSMKVYDKKCLLENDQLESSIVDKLANDRSITIRYWAVSHKNISSQSLSRALLSKKNFDREQILSSILYNKKLDFETRLTFVEKYLHNIEVVLDFYDIVYNTSLEERNQIIEIFVNRLLLKQTLKYEYFKYIPSYINLALDEYSKIYEIFLKRAPSILLVTQNGFERDNQTFSKTQIKQIFKAVVDNNKNYGCLVYDLGPTYLKSIPSHFLNYVIKTKNITKKEIELFLMNENFNEKMIMKIINTVDYDVLLEIARSSILTEDIEQRIYNKIKTHDIDSTLFYALLSNPTHNFERSYDFMVMHHTYFTISSIMKSIISSNYPVTLIDKVINEIKIVHPLTALGLYIVENNTSEIYLNKIWDKYWDGQIISYTPRYRAYNRFDNSIKDTSYIIQLMITESSLSYKFAYKYYKETNEVRYCRNISEYNSDEIDSIWSSVRDTNIFEYSKSYYNDAYYIEDVKVALLEYAKENNLSKYIVDEYQMFNNTKYIAKEALDLFEF